MLELRWKEEIIGSDGSRVMTHKVLQYREREGPKGEDWWSEWMDVPVMPVSLPAEDDPQ